MCSTFITCECTVDFTDLLKEVIVLETHLSRMKAAADSKAKGKKPGSTHGLLG